VEAAKPLGGSFKLVTLAPKTVKRRWLNCPGKHKRIGNSWYQNVTILDFIGAKDDGGGDDNWSCKTCKAPVKSSPPTNQHPTFYRPDVLLVAKPTKSEYWREDLSLELGPQFVQNISGVFPGLSRTLCGVFSMTFQDIVRRAEVLVF